MATRKTPSKKIIMKKGSDYSQVKTLDPKDAAKPKAKGNLTFILFKSIGLPESDKI